MNKNKAKILFLLQLLLFSFSAYSGNMSRYCSTPPFLTTSVAPNILFVIDKSGSMSWAAYYKTWSSTNDIHVIGEYDPNKTYEGYFIPDKVYEQNDQGIWVETNKTEDCSLNYTTYYAGYGGMYDFYTYYWAEGTCSGNKLNFARMTRVDLLRWAITGGRPEGCSGFSEEDCDPDLACTGDTCILETYPMYKDSWSWESEYVQVPKSRIKGILQIFENQENRPRFGALFYSNSVYKNKIYVGDYPSINNKDYNADPNLPYTYLKRAINYVDPGGSTATGPAMWEAYDYFKQSNDHQFGGFNIAPGTYKDPNYFCNYSGENCKPVPCAKNFVILASDGQWNTDSEGNDSCSIDDGFELSSSDPVVPAYRMHTDILRNLSSLSGVSFDINVSGVYALGLFLGGTGELSLKNVAMYGSFDTTGKTWPDSLSGYPQNECDMDDCGWGKGSACTPLPSSSPDWDSDGDGNPDTFLNAQNALEIKNSLIKFIRNILKRTASGTSLSVLSEKRKNGAIISQAVFYPQKYFGSEKKVTWVGSLFTYWGLNTRRAQNLREDSFSNYILDVYSTNESQYDHILDFFIDNSGKLSILSIRSNPDGTIKTDDSVCSSYTIKTNCNNSNYCLWNDTYSRCELNTTKTNTYCNSISDKSDCNSETYCYYNEINQKCMIDVREAYDIIQTYSSLDDVHYLWDEGAILRDTSASSRNIFGVIEDGSGIASFTPSNYTKFDDALGNNPSEFPSCLKDSDGNPDYEKLIRYIRGEYVEGCRERRDESNRVWKLGDIIYSTPQTVSYLEKGYTVLFTGSNDGMLHAFLTGYMSKTGLNPNQAIKICDDKDNCTTDNLGKELWAFIPKNAMPYLRYLADPDYCHLYITDLKPFIIKTDYDRDDQQEVILIGGMRLGGACGCSDSNCLNPPSDTCSDPRSNSCIGLSAYFALDITDPENPVFLWEFSHPDLAFSYSGPAYIRYRGNQYIMFVSGPTNHLGDAAQNLHIFVLKLNNSFKFDPNSDVYNITPSGYNNAFGGRLFTEGIDSDNDGNTDLIFFGISQKDETGWKGNIIGVRIDDTNPANWDIFSLFENPIKPVTSKVEYMKCFNMNYIYFGTGRWFYKADEKGESSSDTDAIYGVRIDECISGGNCSISSPYSADDTCSQLASGTRNLAWTISLDPSNTNYFKERVITDPTLINGENLVLFTTMQPTGDLCGFGGRTRVWALNCATGAYAGEACPGGGYATSVPTGTIYLQASGANIVQIKGLSGPSEWISYTPPESATQYISPTGYIQGEILLWLEK